MERKRRLTTCPAVACLSLAGGEYASAVSGIAPGLGGNTLVPSAASAAMAAAAACRATVLTVALAVLLRGRWVRGSGALRASLPPLASLALLVWLLGPATSLAITLGPLAALVAWVAFYVHVLGGGRGPPVDNAAVARVLAAGGATHDAA